MAAVPEARLAHVIAAMHTGVLVEDLDRRVILANAALCALFGTLGDPDSLVGRDVLELMRASRHLYRDAEAVEAEATAALRAAQPRALPDLRMADGRIIERDYTPIVSGGRLEAHMWQLRDVTARTQAEQALRASEARSAATISTALDAIVSVDANARILELNAAAEAMLGHRREDAIGRSAIELLFPPEQRDELRERLRDYRRTGTWELIGRRVEAQLVRADGERFPAEIAIADIPDADPPMLTAFVRDISDRRRFERELARARDQALEASRLKSEFLAVMSHEIRTPMYGVTGAIDLLRDHPLDPEQRELVDILDESSRSLMGLIDEILDFSKIEAGRVELDVEDIDPATTIEGAAEVFAAETRRKGVSLMVVVAPDVPPWVRGDAGRLRQIVTNLVGNAAKFTDAGEIVVDLSAPDGGSLRLEVRDSGPGIPPQVQQALFEPFTQGDPSSRRSHGGTGLGLAICERLVRLMGGSIAVASRPGEGTTMTVELPCERVPGMQPAWEPPPELRGHTAGVALTSARLAAAMRASLESLGLTVPDSVEPHGVDVWIAEIAATAALPAGATIAVLGEDDRCTAPLPVRRARLAEILVHALAGRDVPPAPVPSGPTRPRRATGVDAARVLVAEDNDVNRSLILRQLSRLGIRARGVGTGPEAVEAVATDDYDAVLMDLRMPGMDGLEATRAIRAMEGGDRRRTPVIAMTAEVQPRDREICLAAGMDDYLAKPLPLRELRRALAAWLPAGRRPVGTLEELASELGSTEAVDELVELWLRDLPRRRADLHDAVARADAGAVRDTAHVLKSTSALFGGSATTLAAEIEAEGRHGDCAAAERRLSALDDALADDARVLRHWCAGRVALSEP